MVPKGWIEHDQYCQLIPNEDEEDPNYEMIPRIGAFEVSVVVGNTSILFFSKLLLGYWPNPQAVAMRVKAAIDDW